ncbi:MAG: LysR family transcriptional regulator [Gammaproteobacteria bacterium]|nr:LysR family transcriptional regulator [Gammaproteobacteria bacterium]
MNLSEIQTFLAIVETGQLNRAAHHLNVTQSTITARLNGLEDKIGQVLFHRRKSGAELTSAGFRFERYAQLMVDIWRQARQETALPSMVEMVFNLGCHSDLWPGFGESLFRHVQQSERNIALSAWSGDQSTLDRWLGSGLIDAALCYTPSLTDSRSEYRLKRERLILVSTAQRALQRWDPGYIYVDSGEEFRKSHAAAYPDGDTPFLTIGSAVWAKDYMLKQPDGSSVSGYLPARLIDDEIKSQRLFPVSQAPEFYRNTYLVVNDDAAQHWPWLAETVVAFS